MAKRNNDRCAGVLYFRRSILGATQCVSGWAAFRFSLRRGSINVCFPSMFIKDREKGTDLFLAYGNC